MNQIQLERLMSQNPNKTWGECDHDTPSRFLSPYGKTYRPIPDPPRERERERLIAESRRRSPSKITKRKWDGK